jgi:hypothetical protein
MAKAFFGIFIFSWIIALLLPWWALFIPAFLLSAWAINNSFIAFLTGFMASGFGWFVQALYIHFANDAILSSRMADMFGVGSPWAVLWLTFLVAAVPGGLAALAGTLFASVMQKNKTASASN